MFPEKLKGRTPPVRFQDPPGRKRKNFRDFPSNLKGLRNGPQKSHDTFIILQQISTGECLGKSRVRVPPYPETLFPKRDSPCFSRKSRKELNRRFIILRSK